MGALGHYLEEEGVATTQISLVREHTVAMQPPRALWVPFILGRPLGAPHDAAFQRSVLLAALRLLEAPSGPVLQDFPDEAPLDAGGASEPFACPVSFARAVDPNDIAGAWRAELQELATWYDLAGGVSASATRGSGLTPEQAAQFVLDFIADPAIPSFRGDVAVVPAMRLACHDLKEFYLRAAAAQPGARAAAEAQAWFWRATVAGKMLFALRDKCRASDDEALRRLGANGIVPRAIDPN